MATIGTFILSIGQSTAGDVYTLETVADINLRVSPYSAAAFNGTHVADGQYSFTNVTTGLYRVYSSTTHLSALGEILVGEDSAVLLTGNQTIGGVKTFSGTSLIVTNDLSVGDDLAVTDDATIGGDLAITGATTASGLLTTGNSLVTGTMIIDAGAKILHPDAPATGSTVANKTYVDAQVASISVSPFQYSDNERYVITNGTAETNKVYLAIQTAIDSCSSPTSQNEFFIYLRRGDSVSTGSGFDNIFYISHAELENYVNIIGYGANTRLVMGTTGASTTKTMNVENCSVWFGNNDIAADRTYNSFTFRNCIIYAYNNLTLTNCKVHNCYIYQASGDIVTLSGSTECISCYFTQAITNSATGIFNGADSLNTSYSLPTDLSLTP